MKIISSTINPTISILSDYAHSLDVMFYQLNTERRMTSNNEKQEAISLAMSDIDSARQALLYADTIEDNEEY